MTTRYVFVKREIAPLSQPKIVKWLGAIRCIARLSCNLIMMDSLRSTAVPISPLKCLTSVLFGNISRIRLIQTNFSAYVLFRNIKLVMKKD